MLFHGLNKLTDCDGENSETDSTLDFAWDCGYTRMEEHAKLVGLCQEIGRMLGGMINGLGPFLSSDR